jgi:hypothetical protein
MSPSEETLMAYADGELDAAGRADVEDAMRADPSIERRIGQFREQRARLQAAYAGELEEPVPEKILAALRRAPPAPATVDFKRRSARARPRTPIWGYTALAASIVIGVAVGLLSWQRSLMIRHVGGGLLAGGALARGLSDQLSGDQGGDRVRVGLSFVSTSGAYCRTFSVPGDSPSAGLACRRGEEWEIQVLAHPQTEGQGTYRTAATDLPPEVLKAAQAEMAGEPLDRAGEIAARAAHWSLPEPH